MSAANETAPAETETAEIAAAQKWYPTEDEAKSAANKINLEAKPTKSGREAQKARVYGFKIPDNWKPCEDFYVVSRSPGAAAGIALTQAGLVLDSVDTPKVVAPEDYVNMLGDEQLAAMQKLITERKKKLAGK